MADQKLSTLSAAGAISAADILYLAQTGSPRYCTVGQLEAGMPGPFPVTIAAVDPTTSNIAPGQWMVWNNTVAGTTKLWSNRGGTLVSVTLA